jgi:hypothetical protein
VVDELVSEDSQQKLIDSVRKTHFYCIKTYEKILKYYSGRLNETYSVDLFTIYHELIYVTEQELASLKSKNSAVLSALDIMQQDLYSLK